MPFGKYRSQPVADLPDGYLNWLLATGDLRPPLDKAVKEALRAQADLTPEHVSTTANESRVHAVFRRLARKWHPDCGGNLHAMAALIDFCAGLTGRSVQQGGRARYPAGDRPDGEGADK